MGPGRRGRVGYSAGCGLRLAGQQDRVEEFRLVMFVCCMGSGETRELTFQGHLTGMVRCCRTELG